MQPSNLTWPDPFASLDYRGIRRHYKVRVQIHEELAEHLNQGRRREFGKLLVGVDNPHANYSASEHGLGMEILRNNWKIDDRLFDLGLAFSTVRTAHDVPALVRDADIAYLKIGVGSEASCMVNPRGCWVANTRTIWAHLVIKHGYNLDIANEALGFYRQQVHSEMQYLLWEEIHRELDVAMTHIVSRAEPFAANAGVKAGKRKYLWADAISNALYEARAG